MSNRTKLTPEKIDVFLDCLRTTANVSLAANRIGMARQHLYTVKKEDKELSQAWDDAVGEALDSIEGALFDRAVNGVTSDVFHNGVPCGTRTEYSDTAAIFLLKCRRPEVFGDKNKLEISGKDGSQLAFRIIKPAERARDDEQKPESN